MSQFRWLIAWACALTLTSSGCGAVCGNGVVETGEQCDNGLNNGGAKSGCTATCTAIAVQRASVQVFYYKLVDEVPGYSGASCIGLGIDHAKVVLDGPSHAEEQWPCSSNSKIFGDVEPGMYQATVTLYGMDGQPLTKPVVTDRLEAKLDARTELTIKFHQEDFVKQDYRGTLYYVPNFGELDATCSMTTPPVATTGVQLRDKSGKRVTETTKLGIKLDGSLNSCSELQDEVTNLPWGRYKLTLAGRSATDSLLYCKNFEVFVGPGTANPTYKLIAASAQTMSAQPDLPDCM